MCSDERLPFLVFFPLIFRSACFNHVLMWHRVLVCFLPVGSRCDWQVVIEALTEKDNERVTSPYFSKRGHV